MEVWDTLEGIAGRFAAAGRLLGGVGWTRGPGVPGVETSLRSNAGGPGQGGGCGTEEKEAEGGHGACLDVAGGEWGVIQDGTRVLMEARNPGRERGAGAID